MRTFALLTLLCVFLLVKSVQANDKIDLFVIEKPIENHEVGQLNLLLESAMRDLLIRVVGGDQILQTPEAQNYLKKARQWVKSYQFANREADGVVIGQKIVVEFDRHRLLADFQKDQIHIWPLNDRPKTLLIGRWEQQGLRVNLSQASLQYRVDLDYRDYSRLLALTVDLPVDDSAFVGLRVDPLLKQPVLPEPTLSQWQGQGNDFVMIFKAVVTGDLTNFVWGLYSLETGERVLNSDEMGEGFLPLLHGSFDSLLELYSRPYRERAGTVGLVQLDVDGLPSYEALQDLERFLQRLKPTFRDVKLVKLQGNSASFEVIYQGSYIDVIKVVERVPHMRLLEETTFSGALRGEYQP